MSHGKCSYIMARDREAIKDLQFNLIMHMSQRHFEDKYNFPGQF